MLLLFHGRHSFNSHLFKYMCNTIAYNGSTCYTISRFFGKLATCQPKAISWRRLKPLQITCVPGLPSQLRPKKPPIFAIMRTASSSVGGCSGGIDFFSVTQQSACHSCSCNTTSQDTSGFSSDSSFIHNNFQATTEYTASAFFK